MGMVNFSEYRDLQEKCIRQEQRILELESELIEALSEQFFEIATKGEGIVLDGDPMDEWYCTNGRSTAVYVGDRLMRLGVLEKNGRHQAGSVMWYRPLEYMRKAGER